MFCTFPLKQLGVGPLGLGTKLKPTAFKASK